MRRIKVKFIALLYRAFAPPCVRTADQVCRDERSSYWEYQSAEELIWQYEEQPVRFILTELRLGLRRSRLAAAYRRVRLQFPHACTGYGCEDRAERGHTACQSCQNIPF